MRRRRSSRRSRPSLLRLAPTPAHIRAAAAPSRQGGCLRRQVRRWRGGEDPGALRWTTFSTRSIRLASPPSVTSEIGSTSGSGTISSSTRTSSAVSVVAGRSSQATGGRKHRTARLAGATIRLATMRGAPGRKRRRGRRWGSKAEPSRSERLRGMRGAGVARVGRSPLAAAVGRGSIRAICAAAGSCASTPSTMIVAGKLIDREASPAPSNKDRDPRSKPDRAGGSADCCRSTTSGRA